MEEREIVCHPIIYPNDKRGSRNTGLRIGEEVNVKLLYDNGNIVGVECPYKDGSICNVPDDILENLDEPDKYERGHCLPQIR